MSENDHLRQLAIAQRRATSRVTPRPSGVKSPAKPPTVELDPQCRARSIDEIVDRRDRIEGITESDRGVSAIRRSTRKAERMTGDGSEVRGTGFTIIKRTDAPIARMLTAGSIGRPELQASEDICMAFQAISGALFLRPLSLERRDRSNSISEPPRVIDAVSRYTAWANIWSARAKRGDPTLEIIIAAVWDERPLRIIEQDLNIRNGAASKATAAGLRDYAARAGWAQGRFSMLWLVSEGAVFRLRREAA